jgi:hypothetical protein
MVQRDLLEIVLRQVRAYRFPSVELLKVDPQRARFGGHSSTVSVDLLPRDLSQVVCVVKESNRVERCADQ